MNIDPVNLLATRREIVNRISKELGEEAGSDEPRITMLVLATASMAAGAGFDEAIKWITENHV